jgi:hypothetical protein
MNKRRFKTKLDERFLNIELHPHSITYKGIKLDITGEEIIQSENAQDLILLRWHSELLNRKLNKLLGD